MNESYEVVKERKDKNKAFHKRLKTYYIVEQVLRYKSFMDMRSCEHDF